MDDRNRVLSVSVYIRIFTACETEFDEMVKLSKL